MSRTKERPHEVHVGQIQPEYMVILRSTAEGEGAVGTGMRLEDAVNAAGAKFLRNWGHRARVAHAETYGWRCDAVTPSGRWTEYLRHTFASARAITVHFKETVAEMTRTGVQKYTSELRKDASAAAFRLAYGVQEK